MRGRQAFQVARPRLAPASPVAMNLATFEALACWPCEVQWANYAGPDCFNCGRTGVPLVDVIAAGKWPATT